MNGPVAIDIYQDDNVQDTPGPLGGFARVKAFGNGIAFLLHKVTDGLHEVDKHYDRRRVAWMSGGAISVTDVDGTKLKLAPRFAAYHFFRNVDPKAQAQHFLENAKLLPGDDAAVDWELDDTSADAIDAFCAVVEAKLKFSMIVYSGNVAKEQLHGKDQRFSKRRLWLAQYDTKFVVQKSWSFPWLWQNNGDDKGKPQGPGPNKIDGIDGLCDNSTVASPMTIKRLYEEWGGGIQPPPG